MIPIDKATDALAKLALLTLGDADEAMRLYYDLGRLAKARPSDVNLRTAMAASCRIIGYRQQAVDHLMAADSLWSSADLVTQSRIANLLRQLGFSALALKRAKLLAAIPPALQPAAIAQNNALTAIQFGDLDFMQQVARQEQDTIHPKNAMEILRAATEAGFTTHLFALQRIVAEIAAPYSVGAEFGLPIHPDDGTEFFNATLHIDGALIHRFDLSDQVQTALEAYATAYLADWPDWWWRYFVDISSAPRHVSIPAKARAKVAA